MTQKPRFRIQFIVKISKLCNMRCEYCYEMNELSIATRISPEQCCRIYENIAEYYAAFQDDVEINFVWHGGEPLIIEPNYYWNTFRMQQKVFSKYSHITTINTVQTNLTKLDSEREVLLKQGFDNVGVSVDLIDELRVDAQGKKLQARTLRNLDRLAELAIPFGCITVLSKNSIPYIEAICEFYRRSRIPCRLLPVVNHSEYKLSMRDVIHVYNRVVDYLFLHEEFSLSITPVHDYINNMRDCFSRSRSPRYFSKRYWNPTMIIDTDGSCYSSGDPWQSASWQLGNLINEKLSSIYAGRSMHISHLAAEMRMAANCLRCEHFGWCSGYPVAEEPTNNFYVNGVRQCLIERAVHSHILNQFSTRGSYS